MIQKTLNEIASIVRKDRRGWRKILRRAMVVCKCNFLIPFSTDWLSGEIKGYHPVEMFFFVYILEISFSDEFR